MNENIVKSSHKKIIFILTIMVVLSIGATYAWFTLTLNGEKQVKLHAAKLSLSLDDSMTEGISMPNAYPMSDTEGLATTGYNFKLKNDGSITTNYVIYLVDLELAAGKSRMSDTAVKYNLSKTEYTADNSIKENEKNTRQLLSLIGENPNRILDSGSLEPNESNTYTLKIWMDYSADNDQQGTVFKTQVKVEGTQIIE